MQSPRSFLELTSAASAACQRVGNRVEDSKKWLVRGPERRERIRVPARVPLSVKFGGIYEAVSETTDISARGMFFAMEQRLEIGTPIEVVFRLPRRVIGVEGVWLRCPADVVRLEEGLPEGKFGIGAKIKSYEVFLG
jgi:PilZ domain